MEQRITIGIDPSISSSGIAVLKGTTLITFGTIKTKPAQSTGKRLKFIYDALENLSEEYSSIVVAMETPFLGKNIKTFQKLCYIQSLIYLWCEQRGYPLHTFSPMEVKMCVTGKGNSSKEDVARRITLMYPSLKGVSFDVTDAVAVAFCTNLNGRK